MQATFATGDWHLVEKCGETNRVDRLYSTAKQRRVSEEAGDMLKQRNFISLFTCASVNELLYFKSCETD